MQRDEVAIVEQARRGDLAAFAELVARFQDLAVGTAFGWLGDIESARDASQEAFLEAYLQLGALREAAAFPAWLRTLVVKHCDRVTRRRRVRLASIDAASEVPSPECDPLAGLADDERARWLRLAVEGLPPRERAVVALHYFADVPGPELARFLELPLSTIKRRLRRARARLRDEGDRLMQETIDKLRPSRNRAFADEIAFFIALRAGDRARVRDLLARSPELVDAQQAWDPALVFEGILPFATRATALITAIERDDRDMLTLLLDAGAHVDGTCGCVTGESPVWAAALLNRRDHLHELLVRGADPNVVAATGNTPLHVAAMRGFGDVAELLLAHGARADVVDTRGRTPSQWALANGHADVAARLDRSSVSVRPDAVRAVDRTFDRVLWSGIAALDLFVPIRRGALVRFPFKAGVGMVVLLGELSRRVTSCGGRAVWTGFTQRPFDLRDLETEFVEMALGDRVERHLANFDEGAQRRRDAFAAGLARVEALRAAGDEVLVVLLCEPGFEADVDASLVRFANDAGPGRVTTVVVTAFPETPADVWSALSAPYGAQIVLDRRRARKRIFPSIDPLASLSDALVDDVVGRRHVAAVRRVKDLFAAYDRIDPRFERFDAAAEAASEDPTVAKAHRLFAALRQSFVVAEPFTGEPARWPDRNETLDTVERILDQ
ncbi:MAG TPA: sigma-70 family RNA polymerase sigma factor [Pseudomonadales bacterium]|nr:sigma-70 family RNA polymerase sigma factor [Pseudomonadales bacterium]